MTNKKKIYINCIGVDDKIHYCEPHKDICVCGVKVRRKKLLSQDYNKYFFCYVCDYTID